MAAILPMAFGSVLFRVRFGFQHAEPLQGILVALSASTNPRQRHPLHLRGRDGKGSSFACDPSLVGGTELELDQQARMTRRNEHESAGLELLARAGQAAAFTSDGVAWRPNPRKEGRAA